MAPDPKTNLLALGIFLSRIVLVFTADECMYFGAMVRIAVYTYCEDGYYCCENNSQCCADESLSTAAIVGIALGSLFVVAIVGGVIAAMVYNFSKRSGRVESVHLGGDVEAIDTATPGTSAQLPPPYEMAGCAPPAYPGAVMASDSSAVSNDPIPMYKR